MTDRNILRFEFRGDGLTYFIYVFVSYVAGIASLGIAIPWLYCWKISWFTSNTYIGGRRLVFRGTGVEVIGLFFIVILLSFITLGLFVPFGVIMIEKWRYQNTFFEDEFRGAPVNQSVQPEMIAVISPETEVNPAVLPVVSSDEAATDNIEKISEMDHTCFKCSSVITLEGDDLIQETFVCPVCQSINRVNSRL